MTLALFLTCSLVSPLPLLVQQAPKPQTIEPAAHWRKLGSSLWFDPDSNRLVLKAKVVLREGPLEHLLCLKGTKEHEAILATDAAPREIHAGLLLTGLNPGKPIQYLPKIIPPTGDPVAIEIRWRQNDQEHSADARDWVLDETKKTPLRTDWVFAGSQLYLDPQTKTTRYAADDGDLFTVANFANAILDLPFESSANDSERTFVANTKLLPPVGTEVFMVLGPRHPPQPQPLKTSRKTPS